MAAFSETDRLKALFAGSPLDSFEISRSPATSETQSRNNASFTKDLVEPNPWPLVSRVRMDRPVGLLDNGQNARATASAINE